MPQKACASPIRSATAPTIGKNNIINTEKNILFTDIKVARCADGILRFNALDWMRYNSELQKVATSKAPMATYK